MRLMAGIQEYKSRRFSRSFDPEDHTTQYIIDPTHWENLCPTELKKEDISWGQSSKLTGYPGVHKTLDLISCHYWWSYLACDVKELASACPSRTKDP